MVTTERIGTPGRVVELLHVIDSTCDAETPSIAAAGGGHLRTCHPGGWSGPLARGLDMRATIGRSAPMKRSLGRLALAASAAAVVAPGAACTGAECHEVGGFSEIRVVLPSAAWHIEQFCLDGSCGARDRTDVDDDPRSYDFRLVVVDPSGSRTSATGVARTKRWYPNGRGCEPTLAGATLVVAEDGTVGVQAI